MTKSAMPDNACSWDQSKGAPFVPALNSSTLFAYAMMRGPVTNGNYGPLYQVKASPHDSSNSVGLDALKVSSRRNLITAWPSTSSIQFSDSTLKQKPRCVHEEPKTSPTQPISHALRRKVRVLSVEGETGNGSDVTILSQTQGNTRTADQSPVARQSSGHILGVKALGSHEQTAERPGNPSQQSSVHTLRQKARDLNEITTDWLNSSRQRSQIEPHQSHDLGTPPREQQATEHLSFQDDVENETSSQPQFGVESTMPVHYHDEYAYAHYGFLKINGTWVDPDDEVALSRAYGETVPENDNVTASRMDFKVGHGAGKQRKRFGDNSGIPGIPDMPAVLAGPYKLSRSEESVEYAEFIKAVDCEYDSDSVRDHEGDPRDHRISPKTFAKWAEGATRGSRYVYRDWIAETVQEPLLSNDPDDREHQRPKPFFIEPQYDMDTGETLTGSYAVESNPVVLRSPIGLNFRAMPSNFSSMNPRADMAHKRAHYFDGGIDYICPPQSGRETFSDNGMKDALATSSDLESGERNFKNVRKQNLAIWDEANALATEAHLNAREYKTLESGVNILHRGVLKLRAKYQQVIRRRRHLQMAAEHTELITQNREIARAVAENFAEPTARLREEEERLRFESDWLVASLNAEASR